MLIEGWQGGVNHTGFTERTCKAQEDVIEGSITGTSLAFEDQKKGPVGMGRRHSGQVGVHELSKRVGLLLFGE